MKRKLLIFGTAALLALGCMSFFVESSLVQKMNDAGIAVNDSTPSIKMYNSIVKYSVQYNIPIEYAFGLSYEETRYKGPADITYKAAHTSKCGALGPNQIMYSTAQLYVDKSEKLTKKKLKNDIDFNVDVSFRILSDLYATYHSWGKALGAYHTGKPIVDAYAKRILHKKFIWIPFLEGYEMSLVNKS